VAVLGLAYKQDVDDLRESPAIEAAHLLKAEGAVVLAHDPFKPDARIEGLDTCPTLEEAVAGAEALVLLVGHTTLRGLDPAAAAGLTQARIAVDAAERGWSGPAWTAQGFQYFRIGVGK
jgi:UDP-N-acetyl-D-mannosaminuronate dehydrogenase